MYEHCRINFPPDFFNSSELPPHETLDYFMVPPILAIPPFQMDSVYATTANGGGYDSPGYTDSQSVVMQGSGSVDCIVTEVSKNGFLYQLVSSPTELVDSEGSSSSVTNLFSTGDLQGVHSMQYNCRSESPLSYENNIIIESVNKTCRYSPKEKRERIDRYRSKKNQRNFNKKIKYVCRKTLADSRTRVKGRFARNSETERTNDQSGAEEGFEDEGFNKWIFNYSDSFSSI